MFWKKEPPLDVIIGPDSGIKGDLTTKGIVKMDGLVDGCIDADWLIVGETGMVKGDVTSRGVVIYGKIIGNITSTEITEIRPKASVEGDICTDKLVISEGAFFDGRSRMRCFPREGGGDILSLEEKVKKSLPN